MNFDRLRFVAERAELGEAREAIFAVTIPERPGAFREFCAGLGPRVVTEFNYRLGGRDAAHIFVGVAVASREDAAALARELNEAGYETVDLSDNELAKLHVRHMVGGRASDARHERPCRFEFPERPGALMQFLETLGGRWNISLFHYRNHGADFGRVLAAFEVPDDELGRSRRSSTAWAIPIWRSSATTRTGCSWSEARDEDKITKARGSRRGAKRDRIMLMIMWRPSSASSAVASSCLRDCVGLSFDAFGNRPRRPLAPRH